MPNRGLFVRIFDANFCENLGCIKLHILDQQYQKTACPAYGGELKVSYTSCLSGYAYPTAYKQPELKVIYVSKELTLKNTAEKERRYILTKYTDPTGDFVVVDSWLVGFVHGFFSTGSGRWSAGWNEANKRAGNDAKIWGGLFASDPNKSFVGRVFEVISRLTWQAPQTALGFLWNQANNTLGRVENVEYFHGATFVVGATRGGKALTLGSYISISPVQEDKQANIRIGEGGYTTMHEYGHYLQSQISGPLYLAKYGLPSALGAVWTEIDANTRSAAYFHKIDPSFNWVQIPGYKYRMLADRVYNPRWFEYPLFFTGVGIPIITAKNLWKPW